MFASRIEFRNRVKSSWWRTYTQRSESPIIVNSEFQ